MAGDELTADAAAIRDAIEGAGTDEKEIYRALRNKTAEQEPGSRRSTSRSTTCPCRTTSTPTWTARSSERADALQPGQAARADAIGLEMAKRGSGTAAPTPTRSRTSTRRTARGRGKAQKAGLDGRPAGRPRSSTATSYDRAHKKEYQDRHREPGTGLGRRSAQPSPDRRSTWPSACRSARLGSADAARLELEKRSFVTDDKVVNKILQSQYERAETEARLDAEHRPRLPADLAAVRGEKWDPQGRAREGHRDRGERRGGPFAPRYMGSLRRPTTTSTHRPAVGDARAEAASTA